MRALAMKLAMIELWENNNGVHRTPKGCHLVKIENLTLYFSYRALVALRLGGKPPLVRRNEWGNTTGRHLNQIDGGSRKAQCERLDGETFGEKVSEYLQEWAIESVSGGLTSRQLIPPFHLQ